jgi:hypothetical protein
MTGQDPEEDNMQVDRNAPLCARGETIIQAPPDKVWSVLTGISRWPEWQAGVSSAALEGELAAGATFRWKANGLGITSTINDLEPERRIGWTGDSLGMRAIHHFALEPQDGGTRVTTEESISGWLARILKMFDPNYLDKSLAGSLQALKARAEGT